MRGTWLRSQRRWRQPGNEQEVELSRNFSWTGPRNNSCMDREHISGLVHRLDDVELAVLLSLVADKHCVLSTEENYLQLLQRQLELVS